MSINSPGKQALLLTALFLAGVAGTVPAAAQVLPPSSRIVQLAGNSLDDYPYFEYVKAFNENAGFEVALDPTRFPDIAGTTADIHIVESRTPAQWRADPVLADVTVGGALTVTFTGTTIQDNTFAVVGSDETLPSTSFVAATGAFTGLGHGYDVVVDMNRDGRLDPGDYIDGLDEREAGLYVIGDTTAPGPLAVTETATYSVGTVFGIPASDTREILYYPTDIAGMDPLPLIVISHGSGHNYTWYGHIGHHMASYGYIVMAHQNGPPAATLLGHTDAVIAQQDQIAGGAINGKIDTDRIIWIGHSWGAINTAMSYDKLVTGQYAPTGYTADSIILISAMLPPAGTGVDGAQPHGVNFHLWTASGDDQVNGSAGCDICQTFQLHDRATGWRMSTIVQGTGHAWFHTGTEPWGDSFQGPCPIGKELTHQIQLGLFLPLIKYFAEDNIPASDFFYRQYERFHPIGIDLSNPCIVVSNECRPDSSEGLFFIDDFQSQPELAVSSSGGAVTYTVHNVAEGPLDDNNSDFSWTPSDPFNGATQSGPNDDSRGLVFDWDSSDLFIEWELVPGARDFRRFQYISFRGAQVTQHPYTMAVLGDETFTLTLRDEAGASSSINIGAAGGGLEQPYQRLGGWFNEMERIRLRLEDFLTNGSDLDLAHIAAVRLDVGPSWGSARGRIVVDEIMLSGRNPDAPSDVPPSDTLAAVGLRNYPNPFNPRTVVELDLPATGGPIPVKLAVYDLAGRRTATLFQGHLTGGHRHRFQWNGKDDLGRPVTSGVYFARAEVRGRTTSCKLVLLR